MCNLPVGYTRDGYRYSCLNIRDRYTGARNRITGAITGLGRVGNPKCTAG